MKRILSACALFSAVLLFSGCDKVKDLIKVNVKTTVEVNFEIDPITQTVENITEVYDNVANTLDAVIKAENSDLGIENIKSAKVEACVVSTTATSVADDNFQALNKFSISLKSDTKPTNTTFAALTATPPQAYTMEVPVNASVDLVDYLKSNKLAYTFEYKGNRKTTTKLLCKARITYLLKVSL